MKLKEPKRALIFFPVLSAFFLTIFIHPLGLQASPDNSGPWSSVKYIEYQLGGSESGRVIPAKVRTRYGIDINSEIRIKIDADSLRAQLAPLLEDAALSEDGKLLNDRIQVLQHAVSQLKLAVETTKETFKLFQIADTTHDYTNFFKSASKMGFILSSMIDTLYEVRRLRLISEGDSEDAAAKKADEMFDSVLSNPTSSTPYNWEKFEELYKEEIRYAQQDFEEQLKEIGMWIEIQAHLIKPDGKSYPIPLTKYNEAKPGPFSPYAKIRFEISPQQEKLYAQYNAMADSVEKTQSLGQAYINSITMQFNAQRRELDSLFSIAHNAVLVAGKDSVALSGWAEQDKWQQWFASAKINLESTNKGRNLIVISRALKETIGEIKDDILVLNTLGGFEGKLSGMTPERAMKEILINLSRLNLSKELVIVGTRAVNENIWEKRVDTINSFLDSLDGPWNEFFKQPSSVNSPVKDLRNARDSFSKVAVIFKRIKSEQLEMLALIIGSQPAIAASNLPVPPGQKKQEIIGDPGDSFDLAYLNPPPDKHDQVKVKYRFFYKEEQPIKGAEWEDNFLLRVFGWQDQVIASLIFVRHEGDKSYYPTAALSWILDKHSWPKSGESGLRSLEGIDWFSGMGFSTMSLDFEEKQNVELGIAATVSVINNFLLAGYGVNLQAIERRWFGFFAIRLINQPGFVSSSMK